MDSKNKLFKLGEVSYYYLPYETDGKEQFLRIMQHDGKLYINLTNVDSLTPEKTFTCRIFSASSKDINDQSLLSLEVEADGVLRTVTLPINTDGLSMLSNIQSLVENKDISFEIIEDNYDCPKVDNFNIDPDLNPPPTGEKGDIKRDMRLKLGSRSGQGLKKTEVVVDGKSLTGLGQEIDTEKLGLKTRQVVSLLDSKSYDDSDGTPNILKGALLTVSSQDNTKPVAVFAKEKRIVDGVETEVTTFKISTEFLSEFIEKNPSLSSFPHGTEVGEYTSYDVDQLKLSENLTIEDVQIKAASEQFAVMFSALGMQLVDKDKNLGKFANTENPFNIGVTTDFLSSALSNQPGLLIDKKGKGFDALLIAAIQQKRQIGNDKHGKANEPVSIKFDQAGIELYSLPIVLKDEEGKPVTEYLNIKKDLESGKSYIYMHSTNELPRSKTVPQFHEIDIIHLEESNDSTLDGARGTSLFIGFKSGKSANRANIEIDYTANQTTLKTIKTVLDSEFERTPVAGSEHSTAMFAGEKRKIGDEEYTIYSRPTESSSEILSLSDVAILKSTHIEDEDPDKPVEKSGFITDPPVIDPPTPPHDSPEPPHDPPEPPHDPPAAPHDPTPEEPDEELPEMKWKTDIGKPKAKPSSLKKWLIAFFALGTLLSMVVPILGIVSGILAGAIVVVDVKPWVVDAYKDLVKYNQEKNKNRDKDIKELSRENSPLLEKETAKALQKSRKKSKKLTAAIIDLEREKIEIQNNPKLTDAQKLAQIKSIDEKLSQNKKSLETELFRQQYLLKNVDLARQGEEIRKKEAALAEQRKEIETTRNVRTQNKRDYEQNVTEIQKRIDSLKTKGIEKKKSELKSTEKEIEANRQKRAQQKLGYEKTVSEIQNHIAELKTEQSNMSELEALNNKLTRGESLSESELQKLEELKKKLKKAKKQKSSDYTSEISTYETQLDATNRDIVDLQRLDADETQKENDLLQQLGQEITDMESNFKKTGGIGCDYDTEIVNFEGQLRLANEDVAAAQRADAEERSKEDALLMQSREEITNMQQRLQDSRDALREISRKIDNATGDSLSPQDFVLPDEEGLLPDDIANIESANEAQRKRIESRNRRDSARRGDSQHEIGDSGRNRS